MTNNDPISVRHTPEGWAPFLDTQHNGTLMMSDYCAPTPDRAKADAAADLMRAQLAQWLVWTTVAVSGER